MKKNRTSIIGNAAGIAAEASSSTGVDDVISRAIEAVATRRFGPLKVARVAYGVKKTSLAYNRRETDLTIRAAVDPEARLRFFLRRDLHKVQPALAELHSEGALPSPTRTWRVLDLGAGLGAMTFGLYRFAQSLGVSALDVTAIDADRDGLSIMEAIAETLGEQDEATGTTLTLRTETRDLRGFGPSDARAKGQPPYDLILFGLVLNELRDETGLDSHADAATMGAWLSSWQEVLDDEGSLIVIEPALKAESRHLQATRDSLIERDDIHVFLPCFYRAPCPMLIEGDRDWCHAEIDMPLDEALRPIAKQAGLRDHRPTFSQLVLRKQKRSIADGRFRLVSGHFKTKGKLEVVACGGAGLIRLRRLDRHRCDGNAALESTPRGHAMTITWPDEANQDSSASARRIDRDTSATALAQPSAMRNRQKPK